jgi:hypothetical protein
MFSKIILAASFLVLSVGSAQASCYGTGSYRYCDGIGGPGATYTPIDKTGPSITDRPGRFGEIRSTTIRTPMGNGTTLIELLRGY